MVKTIIAGLFIALVGFTYYLVSRVHRNVPVSTDFASLASTPLRDLIEETRANPTRFTSVESFVQSIPKRLRENHEFVYSSRSIQGASWDFPRVLLFTPSEMVAFTGEESQRGGHAVESIIFDETSNQYHFYETEFVGGQAVVHEDPVRCFKCHEGLPIFDFYPLWVGMYGSEDDCAIRPDCPANKESNHFWRFQKNHRHSGRYALLPAYGIDFMYGREGTYKGSLRPGDVITKMLTESYSHHIANTLSKNNFAKQNENLLIAFLDCKARESCDDILSGSLREKFEQVKSKYRRLLLTRLYLDQKGRIERHFKLIQARKFSSFRFGDVPVSKALGYLEENYPFAFRVFKKPITLKDFFQLADNTNLFRTNDKGDSTSQMLLLKIFGIDWVNFSFGLYPRYSWPFTAELPQISEELLKNNAMPVHFSSEDLKKRQHPNYLGTTDLPELHERVVEHAVEEARANQVALLARLDELDHSNLSFSWKAFGKEGTEKICLRCHDGSEVSIPTLDFDHLALAQREDAIRRIDSKDPKVVMPPNDFLIQEERDAIKLYLRGD